MIIRKGSRYMKKVFLSFTIGNDPHTEGLFKAANIAKLAGFDTVILEPGETLRDIAKAISQHDPHHIGISYRLTPEVGIKELKATLFRLKELGVLFRPNGEQRKIAFAGLPKTIEILREIRFELPCQVFLVAQETCPLARVASVLDFLEIYDRRRENILEDIKEELFPYQIEVLDQLAEEVISKEEYRLEPPLNIPSERAISSLPYRAIEAQRPLIRTHFGIPSDSIGPTVEGIRILADAKVVDEISLGSSDLSQRYFGKPEEFKSRKNDGGVPYKDYDDLVRLFQATRRGNYPSIKPYAHVSDILNFIDICIEAGMLIGAHQAIPLFWFNELDGRGPSPVPESIEEHILAVKKLAELEIPTEMNDPNQWASRYAHDSIIVADYGLITAVMVTAGVKDLIYQFQLNKPAETGDFADLAKMTAAMQICNEIAAYRQPLPAMWIETRTGIEHLSPDLERAKYQLARSTLLQMLLDPQIIHLVSYCEANYAAKPEDIIESSQIVRRAIRLFQENKPDLIKYIKDPIVLSRKEHLVKEASFLLREIARLNPLFDGAHLSTYAPYLANGPTLEESIRRGYMAAPGINHPEYKQEKLLTKIMKYGFIDAVDYAKGTPITEEERLEKLKSKDD
ncbi:MAG TPA: cobalamin B12-binding domain-containing protein [Tepidimicrobium sp.]|nr:cobalamin B12-binding domain-containing protein [Tepidimicrobium sp.]